MLLHVNPSDTQIWDSMNGEKLEQDWEDLRNKAELAFVPYLLWETANASVKNTSTALDLLIPVKNRRK